MFKPQTIDGVGRPFLRFIVHLSGFNQWASTDAYVTTVSGF